MDETSAFIDVQRGADEDNARTGEQEEKDALGQFRYLRFKPEDKTLNSEQWHNTPNGSQVP